MVTALQRQLEQLGKTLAQRNNQPVELFDLGNTPQPAPEPVTNAAGVDLAALASSAAVSQGSVTAHATSNDAITAAQYRARVEDELTSEGRRLAAALRARAAPIGGRRDYREAVESLHTDLVTLALAMMQERGHKSAGQLTVHQSGELLAQQLGVSRASLYHYLPELRELGLIDWCGNYTTSTFESKNRTVYDGTLLAISLRPGTQAKITHQDYGEYRDLNADRAAGRTAHRYVKELRQSLPAPIETWRLKNLIIWALTPGRTDLTPLTETVQVSDDPQNIGLEAVLAVPTAALDKRIAAVARAANVIAAKLRDAHSQRFWCDVLWRLLRLHDRGQGDGGFRIVYHVIQRCAVDTEEGFARTPGALAQSRLRQWSGWDELQRVERRRVATVPRAAA